MEKGPSSVRSLTGDSFHELVAERLRGAPWFGLSALIHAVVLGIFLLMPGTLRVAEDTTALGFALPEPADKIQEIDEPKEPPEPDPEVTQPELLDPSPETPVLDSETADELPSEAPPSPYPESALNPIGIGGGGIRGPSGTGAYRNRRPGGRQPGPPQLRDALLWLVRHQDEDGRWDASGFMKHDRTGIPCDGPGNALHDVGVTGLALLALLGDGNTMYAGPHRDAVQRGVLWLRSQQAHDGLVGSAASHESAYGHAIATLALCEAFGLSNARMLRETAQRAVDWIQNARNPYKVWRYHARNGDNDTSVTGWMVMALESAREFGLAVDQDAFKAASAWFDEVTDPSTGVAGYTKRGEVSSRKPGMGERHPPAKTEALTAVALLCRVFLGQKPKSHPVMVAAADTILKKPPVWNAGDGSVDMYYWYHATFAMYQMAGEHWARWSRSLGEVVSRSQRKDGNFNGSWDPVCVWGEDGGRVYSTALMALCLEVRHRYARILGAR